MRVRRLETTRYGALSGRSFIFGDEVTVVLGPNEAGKTTFHSAFETLLYGFEPAKHAQHPLAQWADDGYLHLEGELVRDSGQRLAVERELQTSGTLRLAEVGQPFQGPRDRGNPALPSIQTIPRALYHAVYSLSAGDTLEYGDAVKEHIDDLLLGETGIQGARPLHKVRQELREDAQKLWRSDERGKHRAKELGASLREARKAWHQAGRERDDRRGDAERLAELKVTLADLLERRGALERSLGDAQFGERRADLERRRRALRPLDEGGLRTPPPRDPAQVRAALEDLSERLSDPRARLARPTLELTAPQRGLLERADEVQALLVRQAAREALRARIQELTDEAQREHAAALTALSDLGATRDLEALEGLPITRLEAEARRWNEVGDLPASTGGLWVLALAVVGIAATIASMLASVPQRFAWGALLVVPALLRLVRQEGSPVDARPEDALAALAPLGLEPRDARELELLLQRLTTARQPLSRARQATDRRASVEQELASAEGEDRRLVASFGVDAQGEHALIAERLRRALEAARRREQEVADDRGQREAAQARVDARAEDISQLTAELEAAQSFLREGWPELTEPGEAWEAWKRERTARADLDTLERELRADPRWESVPAELPAAADLQAELDEVRAELDLAQPEAVRLEQELERNPDGVARLHESALQIERELDEVRRERDRLALLDQLLAEAEARHRAKHQPDVLRRAGEYLARVTDGRYTTLDYPHGPEGELHVYSADKGDRVVVGAPLSRGTQEQIYVCLRLGTLDFLDQGREALPLVLDEALVHWDEGRRRAFYPLLQAVAEHRQVVLFTCHESFADEARDAMDAVVVELAERRETAEGEPAPAAEIGGSSLFEG